MEKHMVHIKGIKKILNGTYEWNEKDFNKITCPNN